MMAQDRMHQRTSFNIMIISPGRFRVIPIVGPADLIEVYVQGGATPLTEEYALWFCSQHPMLHYANHPLPVEEEEDQEARDARTREVREYYIRNAYTSTKILLVATTCVAVGTTFVAMRNMQVSACGFFNDATSSVEAMRNVQLSACSFFNDATSSVDRFFVNSEEHVKKLFERGIFSAIFCTNWLG